MSLKTKQWIIGFLAAAFLVSLIFVQWMEVARKREEAGLGPRHVAVPVNSKQCVECHAKSTPGIIDHWEGSTHATKGVGCVECHRAEATDADAFVHYGETIATVVTPRDCSRCHKVEAEEFANSHHAKGGNILASLDNFLAETVEGFRENVKDADGKVIETRTMFNPHAPTPGMAVDKVNGLASANTGCKQCHGGKVALEAMSGDPITVDDLKPGPDGKPTNLDAVGRIKKNSKGQPILEASSWPNTGIGRLNLDGSLGSCSACHSRHDFSPRRARQPENCGKCHLGPDHPQKEIYEESKHGVAFRDLRETMNLNAKDWVLGEDYTQAPTCATCHMSAHTRNGRKITHDPGQRISWSNRPPVSLLMDTDVKGVIVKETDPAKRKSLVHEPWETKRRRMQDVCAHCHTDNYVAAFYKQYDDFVLNYNEKFARPGAQLMKALKDQQLITPNEFDEEIEWTWFYLWHHEGRRARHGASMMAPDYAHWHGMYEVAERFYQELIPQAREILAEAEHDGREEAAVPVRKLIETILAKPEHRWFESQKVSKAGKKDAEMKEAEKNSGKKEPEKAEPAKDPATKDDSKAEPAKSDS